MRLRMGYVQQRIGVGMSATFDAIIIGAGIMGCCSAYELARRGMNVALFEKGTIGEGPTGESSAIIRQH
jgi:glycine/D-amino acid oxidase-like deaminating enzyme